MFPLFLIVIFVADHFSIVVIRIAGVSYGRSVNVRSGTVGDR